MVKWITAIELVRGVSELGGGQGGYNEDHEFDGTECRLTPRRENQPGRLARQRAQRRN